MPVKRTIVMEKKERKPPGNQRAPVRPAVRGAELNPAEVGALHQEAAAFDPHVFLTKLAAGKRYRE